MQHPDAEPEAGNAAPPPPTIGKAPRVDRPSCERQTLILVGGSVRAASESAQRAGIDVVAVDASTDEWSVTTQEKSDTHNWIQKPPAEDFEFWETRDDFDACVFWTLY